MLAYISYMDPMGMMDILMDENSEHFLGFPAFDPEFRKVERRCTMQLYMDVWTWWRPLFCTDIFGGPCTWRIIPVLTGAFYVGTGMIITRYY